MQGVADGTYDLGVVGTQVFDTLGITSFQALNAPMLVDSYALQAAVLDSGLPEQMMEPLGDIGVAGLATMAGTLRKPVAVEAALVNPADWRGATFATYRSEAEFEAVRALAASPKAVLGGARDQAVRTGSIDGFESGLLAYRLNMQYETAPYLTTNVTLWPQMLTLVANPDVDGRLSTAQRDWLRQAADDAGPVRRPWPTRTISRSRSLCTLGARLVQASDAELAALRTAFAPVYAELGREAQTQEALDQIQELKASTPAQPTANAPTACAESDPTGRAAPRVPPPPT